MNGTNKFAFTSLEWFCVIGILLSLAGCGKKDARHQARQLSADMVDSFYVGVASLDVEENERASTLFAELSSKLPDEPAVWANLGVVRLRLGDMAAAEQALATAEKLAPGVQKITVAQAIVDERQGQFVRAIERLRNIPNPDVTILYQLVELLGRTGQEDAQREQLAAYDRILQIDPENLVALFGKARLLARGDDQAQLLDTINRFDSFRTNWTEEATQQLDEAKSAVATGNFRAAATHLTFLQNLSLATSMYKEALATLGAGTGSVGQPIREFLKYPQPEVRVAEADTGLQFQMVPDTNFTSSPDQFLALQQGTNSGVHIASIRDGNFEWNGASYPLAHPPTPGKIASFCAADLNGDYDPDLIWLTDKGLSIHLQDDQGKLTAYTPNETLRAVFSLGGHGLWTFDFEADGDLDLLISQNGVFPRVLRNNGDIGSPANSSQGGFTVIELAGFPELRDTCWADLDGDGDGDLGLLDLNGRVLVSWNDRAGSYTAPVTIAEAPVRAITFGDVSATGTMTLVALDQNGGVKSLSYNPTEKKWATHELARWSEISNATNTNPSHFRIHLADLDNNGAVDIVASAGTISAIWLGRGADKFQKLDRVPELFVTSVIDADGDGLLDLVGPTSSGAATAQSKGTKGYHWQSIHTRTLANQADGRINSFGIGGEIEVRSGQLLSVMPITSPRTHFGLGNHTRAGIARIVWPNGTAQVEFELQAGQKVTAMQRLKGSCPWVFTRAGDKFHFVKDFIWRSPLGMRINSQDTAGVDQTEDWIFISGELLTPHNDGYEIRVTAELWETHFFDHISLMVVDHPASFEVFVDERFVPTQQPKLALIATEPPQPFASAIDESGRDVMKTLAQADGDYVDGFPLGRFQGVGADHWVEFGLPADALAGGKPLVLIGEGWIYPTDSSLNVAISQGEHISPQGLVLEVKNTRGEWEAASGNLGFPAGKNKTVVIPIPPAHLQSGYRQFRLRTNLEIYWDRLRWAVALPEAELKTAKADTLAGELRHRGFSKLNMPERRKPDLPTYDELIGIGPRWRDLEGFYTRHGDVRELLNSTDDRYVIMNAGDEFVLRFAVPPTPAASWKRDFVLVGDGWVKDGDYNTANSPTVHPLPSHASREYGRPPGPITLDPVFRQNMEDWERFHTRYVSPLAFERGLMNGQTQPKHQTATP